MKKIFNRKFLRNDNKILNIYGFKTHNDKPFKQIEPQKNPKPHLRWNPFKNEWVTYSAGRKIRTSFPPKKYCPLCPSQSNKIPTEIPFNNFEIAVFPNRWASFNSESKKINLDYATTKASLGECEVVVYSSDHTKTISQMSLKQIKLLVYTWNERYKELFLNKKNKYILPFENRGEECGVTLHHPHGQIYAYPFIPPLINKEIKAFKKNNFLLENISIIEKKFYVNKNKHFIAFVPPFARYAYEVWIFPKRRVAGPWELNDEEIEFFAKCYKKVVKGYDKFLNKRCPYIMGLHAAPRMKDKTFHFHVEFYPPLRHGNKPKILAGSESMGGVFIMDVLPEDSAKELRGFMK